MRKLVLALGIICLWGLETQSVEKNFEFSRSEHMRKNGDFTKKSLITYLATGGVIYHFWYYKLETVQALLGALSHLFAGVDFSTDQEAQMKVLARAAAFGGGLVALHGLLDLWEGVPEHKAALEIRGLIENHQVGKGL